MTFKQIIQWIMKLFGSITTTTTTTIIIPETTTTTTAQPETTTTTTVPDSTVTTTTAIRDEFTQATIHTAPQYVADWPIVSKLTITEAGNLIKLDVDPATRSMWPRDTSINIHCLLFRNGKWQTGPCDAVRPLPSAKEYSCLCVPNGDERMYVPEHGERVGVVISTSCRHGKVGKDKFRSSIAWLIGR